MAGPVYALNLFNIADRDEYLAYSRRFSKEVQAHKGMISREDVMRALKETSRRR